MKTIKTKPLTLNEIKAKKGKTKWAALLSDEKQSNDKNRLTKKTKG